MGDQTDRLLMEVEFTHRWYRNFLERVRADGYTFRGFAEPPGEGEVVLRHDVDLSLESALQMARLEAELDVRSTYFVLLTSPLYNPMARDQRERIREIESLGHDVGLHFSTHDYPELEDERPAAAVESRVTDELEVLSGLVADLPRTVSFHIPPDWILGQPFDRIGNTYAPAYFEDVTYVADSSQRWRDEPPCVDPDGGPMQLLTHPGLWAPDDANFDGRIEQAIVRSCRHTQRATRAEYLGGGGD